jgi:hypothetical protein
VALGLDNLDSLWEERVTDEILISLTIVLVVRHLDSFSGGSGLIKERSVGNIHLSDLHDSGLEVEERLKSSLSDLSLIRSVWSVPSWIFKYISSDNTWGVCTVVTLTNETFVDDVVVGELSHSLKHQSLRIDTMELQSVVSEPCLWTPSVSRIFWEDTALFPICL